MYQIIDNFLSDDDFLKIKDCLFPQGLKKFDDYFWNYQRGIVRNPDLGLTGYEDYDWIYVHPIYSLYDNWISNKTYSLMNPILSKLPIKELFDIRANCLVPTPKHIYHEFHTDRPIKHSVALFYVTSCNGFTVLKDLIEVECKENRMLIFDGCIEHRSVTSTDLTRSVININYS
jgi:hypothetical protein